MFVMALVFRQIWDRQQMRRGKHFCQKNKHICQVMPIIITSPGVNPCDVQRNFSQIQSTPDMTERGNDERANEAWLTMQPVVEMICSPSAKSISFDAYMKCYTAITNFCVNTNHSAQDANGGVSIAGAELYYRLRTFVMKYLQGLALNGASLSEEALLNYYASRWEMFLESAKILHNLFSYLNRMWIKRSMDENTVGVADINTVLFD
jgi:hypothetical protein